MKKWFKKQVNSFKKRFEAWTTSKTSLYFAIWACIIYTLLNIIFTATHSDLGIAMAFDSTQTTEWFEFWKWVVISGGSITVAKIVKEKKPTTRRKRKIEQQEENI